MALSCIISETKQDIGRKSWFFSYPLHSTPPLGQFPSKYCHCVWHEKTRMVGLPDGKKWRYVQQCRHTTCVWRTDRRTDILRRHSPRYAYTSRGKNSVNLYRNGRIRNTKYDFCKSPDSNAEHLLNKVPKRTLKFLRNKGHFAKQFQWLFKTHSTLFRPKTPL